MFEGRGGEDLATEISNSLAKAYASSFPLHKLSIVQGQKCWKLYVDILILELGGNLFDAVSICCCTSNFVFMFKNLVLIFFFLLSQSTTNQRFRFLGSQNIDGFV